MAQCLISFGANLGAPAVTIGQAVEQIEQRLGSRLISLHQSRLMRTPAVGGPTGQPPFINAVAALHVQDCSAWDVWHIVREVEHALGRVRQERWEARRIDLDVLLFDDQRIWTPQFKLPHPRMVMRRFILQPALDVAAQWREPVSGWTIRELADALSAAPASIALLSHQPQRDERLMDAASLAVRCEQTNLSVEPATLDLPDIARPTPSQRWLGLLPIDQLETTSTLCLTPTPRLVCMLTPATRGTDAAWEDVHRNLARWMGVCPTQSTHEPAAAPSWPLKGPRYLLSTDDIAWAQHEIVAAMDAMDCPVEPIIT